MSRRDDLPVLVAGYLERALPGGPGPVAQVRVGQLGEMWQKPGGRALRFEATETFLTDRVAFGWEARFPILGPLSLRVQDAFKNGQGGLEARLLGVPVMRERGPETDEGEAMRYLAEIPWVPHAIAMNDDLEWTEVDASTVEVATGVGEKRVAVRLLFDGQGDVVGAFAEHRWRREGKALVARPWRGVFSDYRVIGTVRLPARGEVAWELPEGPFTYWRGEIVSVEIG